MNQTDKITHAIVVNEIAKNANYEIKFTPFYKGILKNRLNQLLPELYKCETDYDAFFNKVEESTSVVYEVYENYTKAISSVPIWDCKNVTRMIEAYNKDPKSIEGIVNKILK
jgi:hypothetical protein